MQRNKVKYNKVRSVIRALPHYKNKTIYYLIYFRLITKPTKKTKQQKPPQKTPPPPEKKPKPKKKKKDPLRRSVDVGYSLFAWRVRVNVFA